MVILIGGVFDEIIPFSDSFSLINDSILYFMRTLLVSRNSDLRDLISSFKSAILNTFLSTECEDEIMIMERIKKEWFFTVGCILHVWGGGI